MALSHQKSYDRHLYGYVLTVFNVKNLQQKLPKIHEKNKKRLFKFSESLLERLYKNLSDILKRAKFSGVKRLLTISTNLESYEKIKSFLMASLLSNN